jgi:hypothetical protein
LFETGVVSLVDTYTQVSGPGWYAVPSTRTLSSETSVGTSVRKRSQTVTFGSVMVLRIAPSSEASLAE